MKRAQKIGIGKSVVKSYSSLNRGGALAKFASSYARAVFIALPTILITKYIEKRHNVESFKDFLKLCSRVIRPEDGKRKENWKVYRWSSKQKVLLHYHWYCDRNRKLPDDGIFQDV